MLRREKRSREEEAEQEGGNGKAGRCPRAAAVRCCGCSCSLLLMSTFPPSIAGVRLFHEGLFVRRTQAIA